MAFVRVFWKNNIQEDYLPKTSISGQIVSEILAQLCFDDSIQILLNLTQFRTLGTESFTNHKLHVRIATNHAIQGGKTSIIAWTPSAAMLENNLNHFCCPFYGSLRIY